MGKWLVIENKVLNLDNVTYIENLDKRNNRGSVNLVTVHFVGGEEVSLPLTNDGFPKLTDALIGRSK
jgi:hypothetical protein